MYLGVKVRVVSLKTLFRNGEYLICTSIEKSTLGCIAEMGEKIADEIDQYIKSCDEKINKIRYYYLLPSNQ
jgi:hypothetical protein